MLDRPVILDRSAVADDLDEARMLVEVASAAAGLLAKDERSARALRTILDTLDDRLSVISATVWPEIDLSE